MALIPVRNEFGSAVSASQSEYLGRRSVKTCNQRLSRYDPVENAWNLVYSRSTSLYRWLRRAKIAKISGSVAVFKTRISRVSSLPKSSLSERSDIRSAGCQSICAGYGSSGKKLLYLEPFEVFLLHLELANLPFWRLFSLRPQLFK